MSARFKHVPHLHGNPLSKLGGSWYLTCFLALVSPILASVNTATAQRPSTPIEIWILPSLLGYVEPCGCTVDVMLGGLDRLVGASKSSPRNTHNSLRIVSGHTFFDPKAPVHRRAQDQMKSDLIVSGLKAAGFQYIVPAQMPKALVAPVTKAQSQAELATIVRPMVIEHGLYKVGVLPIQSEFELKHFRTRMPPELTHADYVIAFSFVNRLMTRRLVRDVSWIDLAIVHHEARERPSLDPVTSSFMMEAGDRGRHIAKISITNPQLGRPLIYESPKIELPSNVLFSAPLITDIQQPSTTNKQYARLNYELMALDDNVQKDRIFVEAVGEYTKALKTLYVKQTREDSPLEQTKTPYAGVKACADCHPDAVDFWKTTKHAQAWSTLEDLNKTFDAECVGCHVTGWQAPRGTRIGFTAGLENIQCEVCHGPGKAHVESGGDSALLKQRYQSSHCLKCHNAHHSPRFSYPKYRQGVIGVGHGVPMQ